METQHDVVGTITEQIMALWQHKCDQRKEPRPTVGQFNAAYEAVSSVLREEVYR